MPTNRYFKSLDMNAATKQRDRLNLKVHFSVACTTLRRDEKFSQIIGEGTIVYIVSIALIPATQDGKAVKEARNHEAWHIAVIRPIIGNIVRRWDEQVGYD